MISACLFILFSYEIERDKKALEIENTAKALENEKKSIESLKNGISDKLIRAGYSGDDRAVIAYRVSWPDEKIIDTTIGNLEHALFENRINRQALIMVGGNISYDSDKKSYLYNPEFTHLFRKSSKKS